MLLPVIVLRIDPEYYPSFETTQDHAQNQKLQLPHSSSVPQTLIQPSSKLILLLSNLKPFVFPPPIRKNFTYSVHLAGKCIVGYHHNCYGGKDFEIPFCHKLIRAAPKKGAEKSHPPPG